MYFMSLKSTKLTSLKLKVDIVNLAIIYIYKIKGSPDSNTVCSVRGAFLWLWTICVSLKPVIWRKY